MNRQYYQTSHPGITLALLAVSFLFVSSTLLSQELGKYAGTHHDPWIPNFGHPSNIPDGRIESVQDGDWTNPDTWGGSLPMPNTTAIIHHNVDFSTQTEVYDLVIYPGGALTFSTTSICQLTLGTLQVHTNASLTIGTQSNPIQENVRTEIVFKNRPFDLSIDPAQYGNGLIAFGKVSVHGRAIPDTFIRLSDEPIQGGTSLALASAAANWRVGDEVIIPDTRQTDPRPSKGFLSQTERIQINSISQGNLSLYTTPTQHTHRGARDGDDQLDFLPHVGNLTRNVQFRSENKDGVRGHGMFIMRADIDIRYASFLNMGRTSATALDSTTFDESGSPITIGTNQVARYPIHTHHLIGPASPQTNGFQFTLIGNVVDNGFTPRLEKWGITIHGSHDGLIQDNIVVNYTGANIVTEDGSESFNVFDHNLSLMCPAFGILNTHDRGTAGTGFWFRGQNNAMRNNVAADHATSGYSINAYRLGNEATNIPTSQGSSSKKPININTLPILEFANNESYGPAFFGLDLWEIGSTGETLHDVAPSTILNFKAWHVRNRVIDFYRCHRILMDGITIRGDAAVLRSRYATPMGINLSSTYRLRDFKIRNADIQGMRTGILVGMRVFPNDIALGSHFNVPAPQDRPGIITIEDSYLRNYFDIAVQTRKLDGSPRETLIRNVTFDPVNMSDVDRFGKQQTISMNFNFGLDARAMDSDRVFVEDYQGITSNNFRVFYREQDPTFIVPQTTNNGRSVASPEIGLTNQQNWNTYGIAVAGELAPCTDDFTFPEIEGFTCTDSPQNPPPNEDTEAPSPPSQLIASQVTSDSIQLGWAPSLDNIGVQGYLIQSNGIQVGNVPGNSFTHLGLTADTTYIYTILAFDAAGNHSPESTPLVITTERPQASGGQITLNARDQFGTIIPEGSIRIGSNRYPSGTELALEFDTAYRVRGEFQGITGVWRTIVLDPNDAELVVRFQTASAAARDQNGAKVTEGHIRVSGIANPINAQIGTKLSLPLGVNVNIRGERLGIRGSWTPVTFDSALTDIGRLFHRFDTSARDQNNELVSGTIRVSSYTGTVDTNMGAQLALPIGARVNIRGERESIRGPWQSVTIDSELVHVGSRFWTCDSATLDQFGNAIMGCLLRISGFYQPVPTSIGSIISLPQGANVKIRPERRGLHGAWRSFVFDSGLESIGQQFQTMDTVTVDASTNAILGGLLTISNYQGGNLSSGEAITLPLGSNLRIRATVNGERGSWNDASITSETTVVVVSY